MKILVVEDDKSVAQAIQLLLSSYNYAVDIAPDGEVGKQMAEVFSYDLVVLDVILPKLDGLSLCRELRIQKQPMPILLLTGQDSSHQKAAALNVGADDYVVKPFDSEELIARIHALLRRRGGAQPIIEWGHLQLDPENQKVVYGTQTLNLTPKEFAILELLLRHGQRAFSAQEILNHAWDSLEAPGEETVRFHIKALRKKLRDSGAPNDLIKTIYGVGYGLNPLYATIEAGDEEQPTSLQVAELSSVNQELREMLEEMQMVCSNLEAQAAANATQLQQAQQLSQQWQRQWQALLDYSLDGIVVIDANGYPVDANQIACELLGITLAELWRSPLTELLEPIAEAWQRLLRRGRISLEVDLSRGQDQLQRILLTAVAHINPDRHLIMLRPSPRTES